MSDHKQLAKIGMWVLTIYVGLVVLRKAFDVKAAWLVAQPKHAEDCRIARKCEASHEYQDDWPVACGSARVGCRDFPLSRAVHQIMAETRSCGYEHCTDMLHALLANYAVVGLLAVYLLAWAWSASKRVEKAATLVAASTQARVKAGNVRKQDEEERRLLINGSARDSWFDNLASWWRRMRKLY